MPEIREQYKLGDIEVTISTSEKANKLLVQCFNGEYKSEFMVSEYEYTNYRRLMNQRITDAYSDLNEE